MLLLDEPAAGVPQEESGEVFEAVAGLSNDLTLLFIEHDMHVVFRFASHIIVLVGGAIFTEGTPAEIAADRACAKSIWASASMADSLLKLDNVPPATAMPWCCTAFRWICRSMAALPCLAATASASRRCC